MLLSEVHSISILVKIGVFFKTNHLPALECGTEDNTFPAFYFGHNPERNTIRELCRLLSINIMARHSPEIFINPSPPPGPRMAGSRGPGRADRPGHAGSHEVSCTWSGPPVLASDWSRARILACDWSPLSP